MDMAKKLSVQKIKSMIGKQVEYALIDVREQEEFSKEHQLLSCCIPYSRIELSIERLVPSKKTPVILTDSGSNVFMRSDRAARAVEALGYTKVYIQKNGLKAWVEAGYETFEGVNTLSKAFGELVAETCNTPLTKPEELYAMLKQDKDVVILDCRPYSEYNNMCIPDGKNAPGAELVYRVLDQAPNPETPVIVNCAGRTRSLIGVQSLINANIPNPVSALKGGTMGWELAGLKLEYGQIRYTDFPSDESIKLACERAAIVSEKAGVKYVDLQTLKQWEREVEENTLYLFDVRQPQEFEAGHYPGSVNAQSGQLVQATDEYGAVRCGRYVVMDDTGARANMTASWLTQMGYPEIYVLIGGIPVEEMTKRVSQNKNTGIITGPAITPETLYDMVNSSNVLLIDVGCSDTYKVGHIPGSLWVPRSRISLAKEYNASPTSVVIVADSVLLAQNTLADAVEVWPSANVVMLSGGFSAWAESGFPIDSGMNNALCVADDVWYKPYEDIEADPAIMQAYFDWEYELVTKINRDGDAHFRVIVM
jgi:rhodanese-related sulfurtransferase